MKASILVLSLGLLSTARVHSALVSYSFIATPDLIWGSSVYGVVPQPSDVITGFLTYDTAAPFTTESPSSRIYNQSPMFAFGFTVRGVTIQSDSGYKIYSSIQTLSGEVVEVIQLVDNDGTLRVSGLTTPAVDMDLAFTIHTPNPSLTLPFDINSVGTISFQHGSLTTTSASGVTYDINVLTPLPEPSAGALLLAGLAAWRTRRLRLR